MLTEFIGPFLIGILCIIIGISNRKGNISLLHSYHRHRVLEKDKLPMGKKVGLGTIIIGSSMIICSILSCITIYTEIKDFYLILNNVTKKSLGIAIPVDSTENHFETICDNLLDDSEKTNYFFTEDSLNISDYDLITSP